LTGAAVPRDRVIDGRSLLPLLKDSAATLPERPVFGMQGNSLATIRLGKWKLHVRSPGLTLFSSLTPQERAEYVDPRGPDGVNILAPFEQAKVTQHPGIATEGRPEPMQLFDLAADRSESHNVADQYPDIVSKLKSRFDAMQAQVPDLRNPPNDYLFKPPPRGQQRTLMRLIGGDLRYDRVPRPQQKLLKDAG
jgi:arylsulfatase